MKRAIVFAHYDLHGKIDPYVEFMLRSYRRHADKLIVISAAGNECDLERLRGWCDIVLRRDNVGHDFVSWKLGVSQLGDIFSYDEILFTNDSIYGPLFDLGNLFRVTDKWNIDFWGLARSHQKESHIQSYFFAFRRKPINEGFFAQFWESVEVLADKSEIIDRYEIGLSQRLEEANYSCATLFNQMTMSLPARIRAGFINGTSHGRGAIGTARSMVRNRRILNPTHKLWRSLIESGAPFIKVELMRKNPLEMDLALIKSYIAKGTLYDLGLIENHVRRTR